MFAPPEGLLRTGLVMSLQVARGSIMLPASEEKGILTLEIGWNSAAIFRDSIMVEWRDNSTSQIYILVNLTAAAFPTLH